MVSAIKGNDAKNALATFTFNGEDYKIYPASGHKCPRCWQFISKQEGQPCTRCAKVLGV